VQDKVETCRKGFSREKMGRKDVFTKGLAIVGTILVWFPILATIVITVVGFAPSGVFRFDYLMPAELFPAALAGGGLLLGAALMARSRRAIIGWSLAAAVAALVGSQALAEVSGLASGTARPGGLPWALVLAMIGIYTLALVVMCVGGVLLLRDLFQPRSPDPKQL
jgi:hypothetical protein